MRFIKFLLLILPAFRMSFIWLEYRMYLSCGITTTKFRVSVNQPRTILVSPFCPSVSHVFSERI